jgi:hypothetical protein
MSLLENQSFKKKINFVKSDDENKVVSFVININCNHDIDKSILKEIEETINDMFLKDYVNQEDKEIENRIKREQEKQEKEKEKESRRADLEQKKRQLENDKIRLENLRILNQSKKI